MPSGIVQSKQNARLKELRRALANPGRDENGCVILKAETGWKRLCVPGFTSPVSLRPRGAERLLEGLSLPPEYDVLLMPLWPDAALATETPQPIVVLLNCWIGPGHIRQPQRLKPVSGDPGRTVHQACSAAVVVLAGLQDPGKPGDDCALGGGFRRKWRFCLPGTVSAWNQKAVTIASAGASFAYLCCTRARREAIAHLRQAGVRTLAATMRGAQPADLVQTWLAGCADCGECRAAAFRRI